MQFDLHTHTTASDGTLSPTDLLALADENGVDVLSITDHDTVAAYERIDERHGHAVRLVPGIELSTTWAGRSIHVVGLNIDPANRALHRGIAEQQNARIDRARIIARRLEKIGVRESLARVEEIAAGAGIGRPHFARHLVEIGLVKDSTAAFRRYLGAGKTGDVKAAWVSLPQAVQLIDSAGGIAVLAHPTKYKLTATKLRLLLADFVAAGGRGLEVICGAQTDQVTRAMAGLAENFGLAASSGSDFHTPGKPWASPGRFGRLPSRLEKVWETW